MQCNTVDAKPCDVGVMVCSDMAYVQCNAVLCDVVADSTGDICKVCDANVAT